MVADSNVKSSVQISSRIIEAILSQRLAPGTRLGEQQLCEFFDVSRTLIREALTRLVTRGIVIVNPRRGWFVLEPSVSDAREAFEARRVIELGLLRQARPVEADCVAILRAHLEQEKAAIDGADAGVLAYLLGEFHVCMCECLGNRLLATTMRDLTARTALVAMRCHSQRKASDAVVQHAAIVEALAAADLALAEQLMLVHLDEMEADLQAGAEIETVSPLRLALAPLHRNDGMQARQKNPLQGFSEIPITQL
jgi:DNA-binding GntR family transcriptional regulator